MHSVLFIFCIQLNWLLCHITQLEGIDAHSHTLDRDIPEANNTSLQRSQEIYHNKRGQKNLDISGLLCYSLLLFSNHLRQANRNYCYNFCWCCIYTILVWLQDLRKGRHYNVLFQFAHRNFKSLLSGLLTVPITTAKKQKMAPSGWKIEECLLCRE